MGIATGGQIIRLKTVNVVAWEDSYASQEYDLTHAEWEQFKARMNRRRARGKYATFSGRFDPAILA